MYSRKVQGKEYTFGVSGMLYKSNILMYDHQTESLWSQVLREAVAGPRTSTRLTVIPSTLTTWAKWKKNHPDTEVLSLETGHSKDYSRDPYESYYKGKKGFLSLFKPGPGEEEKQLVAGVVIHGLAKAYPIEELRQNRITDTLAGKEITLMFDHYTDEITIQDDDGNDVPFMTVYWFVWKGIYKESGLWK